VNFHGFQLSRPRGGQSQLETKVMSKNNYKGIDPFIINQVRYHSRSLIRHPAIHGMEVEDIEQELMLDVLSRTQAYDPEKASWRTFVDRILNHKIANLIEDAKALKRGGGVRAISLDALLENPEGENDELPDPAGDPTEAMHLAIDLKQAMQALPKPLVVLMFQLGEHNPSELSRMTRVPRATLYGPINTLRGTLREQGVHHYLN
jgi:DNA-directed RNA polymerase specialized sigma24 family protein